MPQIIKKFELQQSGSPLGYYALFYFISLVFQYMTNALGRALRDAGAAVRAFEPVDASQVSLDRYCLRWTGAGAYAAPDAADGADFLHVRAPPLRVADHMYAGCFRHKFQYRFRADSGACAAADALVGIDVRQAVLHTERAEHADFHAAPETDASEGACAR